MSSALRKGNAPSIPGNWRQLFVVAAVYLLDKHVLLFADSSKAEAEAIALIAGGEIREKTDCTP